MRAAIHIDRPRLLERAAVVFDRDQVLRLRVLLFPDAQVERAAIDVRRYVHAALLLGEREAGRVPAVRVLARRIIERETGVVGQFGAGNAIRLILVVARLPDSGEVRTGLSERREAYASHQQRRERDHAQDLKHDVESPTAYSTCDPT